MGVCSLDKRIVNVPVATVWTSVDSPRELDRDAIGNPADVEAWLTSLTLEESLDFYNNNMIQTQLLYGEAVLVVEEKGDWASVLIPSQSTSKNEAGYPGWVPKVQLTVVLEGWNLEAAAVVTRHKARLGELELSYLTALPFLKEESGQVYVQTPDGSKGVLDATDVQVSFSKGNGRAIVAAGEQFLGLPYLWGGMSSFGYDCSGLAYSMCKANGYVIPRDAHDQAASGKEVALEKIEPGDLLFFAYEEGKGTIHHVGIYYGNGKLLHSPNTGKTVEIIDLAGTIYERELCAARRYWEE
jgi:cell wall-associated NlpC family hydrolase